MVGNNDREGLPFVSGGSVTCHPKMAAATQGNLGLATRAQTSEITDDDLAIIPLDQLLDADFLQQRMARASGPSFPRPARQQGRRTRADNRASGTSSSSDFSEWLHATSKEASCRGFCFWALEARGL